MSRAILIAALFCAVALAGGPEWVKIPAGSFEMGCQPSRACPELQTPRQVDFERPFWMHKTEVTVGHFREFVKATGYITETEKAGSRWFWSNTRAFKVADRQPVVYVSLKDAEAYCSWIGARLPTEPEWTYAFRAGETITGHLWWNTDGRYVWYRENSGAQPQPVGRKLPNAWGLHDMEGNAWEWTRTVPPEKAPAAIRGGSWIACPAIEGAPKQPGEKSGQEYQPFSRCPSMGDHIRDDVGFRCARQFRSPEGQATKSPN